MMKILSDDTKWTKGVMARDAENERINILNPSAVKFCLLGAFNKASIDAEANTDIIIGFKNVLRDIIVETYYADDNLSYFEKLFIIDKFNDRIETRFEDIQNVLKFAYKRIVNGRS